MNRIYSLKHDSPTSESLALPFWPALLAMTPIERLALRIIVRERCLHDYEFRKTIIQMCEVDVCLFASLFIIFHETRAGQGQMGRFAPHLDSDQADILALLEKYCGYIDMTVQKARGIGLSYLICVWCFWKWIFSPHEIKLGLLSKDESSLDSSNDAGTLLGKLDLLYGNVPAWMKAANPIRRTQKNHIFENKSNGNLIRGFVPTDEKLRSDRMFCLFADESAFLPNDVQRWLPSVHGTTPSIIYVSTHNGTGTMFYRFTRDADSELVRIESNWWENARCRRGLYKCVAGRIELLDDHNWARLNPDYEFSFDRFVKEGELQSLFTDRAFRRPGADVNAVRQELYATASLESRKMFRPDILQRADSTCLPATTIGFVSETGDFDEDEKGPLRFWQPPYTFSSSYLIGADPSLGVQGGAFAALAVIDLKTGVLIATGVYEEMPPAQFARLTIGLAKHLVGGRGFGHAKILPETTGINTIYVEELRRQRYPAIWADLTGRQGYDNRDRGEAILTNLGRGIADGEITVRDRRLAADLQCFEYDFFLKNLLYVGTEGHGDLSIAAALAFHGSQDRLIANRRVAEYNKKSDPSGIMRQAESDRGRHFREDFFVGNRHVQFN